MTILYINEVCEKLERNYQNSKIKTIIFNYLMKLIFIIILSLISLSIQNSKIGKRNMFKHLNKFHGLNSNHVEHPVADAIINSS